MIDTVLRLIVAKIWRSRIARRESDRAKWTAEFMAWKREHPDRCMYCAYTRWANDTQRMRMKIAPHACVEGNSPPHPLPRATARRVARSGKGAS